MITLPTTLLQIFCKIIPIPKVIIKSIIDADDNIQRNKSINGLKIEGELMARFLSKPFLNPLMPRVLLDECRLNL